MIHTTEKVIAHKVGLLNLAEELQNISQACKVMGFSRETFYNYKKAVDENGVEALLEKSRRKPNLHNRVDPEVESAVLKHALEEPSHGQTRASNELRKVGIFVSQVQALERKQEEKEAHGEIETEHPGYLGSQDTFYVGTIKGIGRIYQQSYIDTFCKVALPVLRILTDRGTEYCGKPEQHDYQLYLALNDIDHTKTKARHPQTNGIVERFHKTILNEFYQTTFRKKIYASLEQLQSDLDEWLLKYNTERTHQGKMCCGRTPFETLLDGKKIWKEKQLG